MDDTRTTMKLEEKLKKSQQKRERKAAGEEKEAKKSRVDRVFVAGRGATVLTETEELDSINYRPKTKQSRLYKHLRLLEKSSLEN